MQCMRTKLTLFEQYLEANRRFRSGITTDEIHSGSALLDATLTEPYFLNGVLKTGLIFAELNGLSPLAYPAVRAGVKQMATIRSLCDRVVPIKLLFIKTVVFSFPKVAWRMVRLRNKRDVARIVIDGIRIGQYIYDHSYRPCTHSLAVSQLLRIAYLLFCYYMDKAVVETYNIKLIVIGDPAYRSGILFQLCRSRGIKCINAVNIERFQMHKYYVKEEFEKHYRDIPDHVLKLLDEDAMAEEKVNERLEARFGGRVQQHDAIRAFANHKVTRSKRELEDDYGLKSGLPLIIVMAHVMTDAPHSFFPMLHLDYEEWIIHTVLALAKNSRINFLVKEHPSAEMYGEGELLRRVLGEIGWGSRLLPKEVHTISVLSSADVVVTCGGTIGVEASVKGIPVVLAAKPPYAGKGFTIEPKSAVQYEELLISGVEQLARLTDDQVWIAKKVAYVMFELFDNDGQLLELGNVPFVHGQSFDEDSFYQNVVEESTIPPRNQRIYQLLKQFHESEDTSIINYNKLRSLRSTEVSP